MINHEALLGEVSEGVNHSVKMPRSASVSVFLNAITIFDHKSI